MHSSENSHCITICPNCLCILDFRIYLMLWCALVFVERKYVLSNNTVGSRASSDICHANHSFCVVDDKNKNKTVLIYWTDVYMKMSSVSEPHLHNSFMSCPLLSSPHCVDDTGSEELQHHHATVNKLNYPLLLHAFLL